MYMNTHIYMTQHVSPYKHMYVHTHLKVGRIISFFTFGYGTCKRGCPFPSLTKGGGAEP